VPALVWQRVPLTLANPQDEHPVSEDEARRLLEQQLNAPAEAQPAEPR
jgi:hypothetical protein